MPGGNATCLKRYLHAFFVFSWLAAVRKRLQLVIKSRLLRQPSQAMMPSPEDIIKVQNADMFVYTGGDSDTWVNEILTDKKHGKVIKLMDLVEKREEEEVEGMEEEKDEDHHHDDEEEHDHDHEGEKEEEVEYDEHVWTSLANEQIILKKLSNALIEIDLNRKSKQSLISQRQNSLSLAIASHCFTL